MGVIVGACVAVGCTTAASSDQQELEPSPQILVEQVQEDDGYRYTSLGASHSRFGPATLLLENGSAQTVPQNTLLLGECALVSPTPAGVGASDPCRLLVADTEDGGQTLVVLEPTADHHSFISGTGRVVDQSIVLSRVAVSDQSVELNGVVVSITPSASLSCRDVDDLVEFAALGSVDDMVAYLDNDNGQVVVLGCAESD